MKQVKVKICQLRETVAENLIMQQNKEKPTHIFNLGKILNFVFDSHIHALNS